MTKPFMYRFSPVEPHVQSTYRQFSDMSGKVLEAAVELLGQPVTMYEIDSGMHEDEIFSVVRDDVLEGKFATATVVRYGIDTKPTVLIEQSTTQNGNRLVPDIRNAMVYYPEYSLIFASFWTFFDPGSSRYFSFIYAADDADVMRFLNYARDRERNTQDTILVCTDTREGVERRRVPRHRIATRDDVLMDERIKTEVYRSIEAFFHDSRSFYTKYNIPYRRGILLYGPPGNGKTTLVQSLVGSVDAPVVYWQITEHTDSATIEEMFSYAGDRTPLILVIEDIDSMPKSARSAFLNTLDGVQAAEGIFLIGTTNYPEEVDPALKNRAGRFDRAYEIKVPDEEMRVQYLRRKGLQHFVPDEALVSVAKRLSGMSFASMNEVYTNAALQWHYEGRVDIESIVNDLRQTHERTVKDAWDTNGNSMGFSTD